MTLTNARRVVRASAIYDLVTTVGFLPFLAPALFGLLASAHLSLGLTGAPPDAADVYTVMFANLMGGLVVVWSAFRLVRPSLLAGAADSAGRALFATGMAIAIVHGASSLLWPMLVLEVLWGVAQAVAVAVAWRTPDVEAERLLALDRAARAAAARTE